MPQQAYLHQADVEEEVEQNQRFSLGIYTQSGECAAGFAEEARAAGFVPSPAHLLRLCADGAGPLDDVVAIECDYPSSAEISALHRLDMAAARSATPTIIVTTPQALDTVFGCMERSHAQILVGATAAQRALALSQAVMHVSGSSLREMDKEASHALLHLTRQVEQLASRLGGLSELGPRPDAGSLHERTFGTAHERSDEHALLASPQPQPAKRTSRPPLPDPRLIHRIIKRRQLRHRFFEGDLFADPAWDMLLDLTAARAEHRRVSVTSLCIASGVPTTTALRWIAQLVEMGLFQRLKDDQDKRRVFIALSDSAADAMARYFAQVQEDALLG